MKYAVYADATGEILKVVTCPPEIAMLQAGEGESVIAVSDHVSDVTYYIDNDAALERSDYTLDALPLPCDVTIERTVYHCIEQPVFNFDAPGEYTVLVDAGPAYLKKEFTIDYQP